MCLSLASCCMVQGSWWHVRYQTHSCLWHSIMFCRDSQIFLTFMFLKRAHNIMIYCREAVKLSRISQKVYYNGVKSFDNTEACLESLNNLLSLVIIWATKRYSNAWFAPKELILIFIFWKNDNCVLFERVLSHLCVRDSLQEVGLSYAMVLAEPNIKEVDVINYKYLQLPLTRIQDFYLLGSSRCL